MLLTNPSLAFSAFKTKSRSISVQFHFIADCVPGWCHCVWLRRYLAESGCTAMCVNLCKAPTQEFFTTQLGMPLTMTPNFEDYSCEVRGARGSRMLVQN